MSGGFYRVRGKRCLDIALLMIGLPLWLPVMLVVAVAVRLKMGRPVVFRQSRPGLRGEPFELLKFRTMTSGVDADGVPLPDRERLTPFGERLRRWSLDELPGLLNVFRGEMSLVGPRPLLTEYLDRYSPEQARRHEVKPGITGWAQVNGRNALTWEEKFELDVWYVDNMNLWLDLKILAMTVLKVLTGEGISQAGQATMKKFKGTGVEE